MKWNATMIATAALAASLMPAFNLCASEAAKPSTGGDKGDKSSNSSVVVAASPVASSPAASDSASSLPAAPAPASSSAAAMPYTERGRDSRTPRIEWFMGYSYLRAMPELADGNRLVYLNGGSTSVAFNLNRYFGIVGDFGGFNNTRLLLTFPGGGPSDNRQIDKGTVFTYLGGPRLSFRSHEDRVVPFVQALFGGVHASEITLSGCTGDCTLLPSENAFALTAGGGLDIRLRRHIALRLFQAEYLMTRFDNFNTGSSGTQNDMRLSTGLVLRFGGHHPEPEAEPVSYSCSANPSAVFQGEPIVVSGSALNLNLARTAAYTWTANGGTVTPDSSTARIDTTSLAPGSYTAKGHVSEGERPGENADCVAAYAVRAYEPPTVSCSANPSSVNSGDVSTISATGMSPQNRPLTYSYSADSGSVTGSGSTATLATVGAAGGPITVTCNVVDDKGQTASSTTTVTVAVHTEPTPMTSDLCSISFVRDERRPSRVDNEAKACLDQVALSLQNNSDAKLALIGNAASDERHGNTLASERAVNTRTYLVNEKGIDPARIAVYSGSQGEKSVSIILVPTGATLNVTGAVPVQ